MLLASEDIKLNVYNLNATVLRKAIFSQVQTLQDSEYKNANPFIGPCIQGI